MLEVEGSLISVVDRCRRLRGVEVQSKDDSSMQTAIGGSESAMLRTRRADKGSKCP
jgi:hypothetical protein